MFKGLVWALDEVCVLHKKNLDEFKAYVKSTSTDPDIINKVLGYHKIIPKLVRASYEEYIGVLIGNDLESSDLAELNLYFINHDR